MSAIQEPVVTQASAVNATAGGSGPRSPKILVATHEGEISFGPLKAHVLIADGRRLITLRGVERVLDLHHKRGKVTGKTTGPKKSLVDTVGAAESHEFSGQNAGETTGPDLRFLSSAAWISRHLPGDFAKLAQLVDVQGKRGVVHAIDAIALPILAEAVMNAGFAGEVPKGRFLTLERARSMNSAFIRIGVIALIDEVCGYQSIRDSDGLQQLLAAYISADLLPWTKRFPDEFFELIFNLRGWKWNENDPARGPRYLGKIINWMIYEQMPVGVLDELRRLNPVAPDGRRRVKHHQFLAPDVGHDELGRRVSNAIILMRAARSWPGFLRMFREAYRIGQIDMFEAEVS